MRMKSVAESDSIRFFSECKRPCTHTRGLYSNMVICRFLQRVGGTPFLPITDPKFKWGIGKCCETTEDPFSSTPGHTNADYA